MYLASADEIYRAFSPRFVLGSLTWGLRPRLGYIAPLGLEAVSGHCKVRVHFYAAFCWRLRKAATLWRLPQVAMLHHLRRCDFVWS